MVAAAADDEASDAGDKTDSTLEPVPGVAPGPSPETGLVTTVEALKTELTTADEVLAPKAELTTAVEDEKDKFISSARLGNEKEVGLGTTAAAEEVKDTGFESHREESTTRSEDRIE